ncbi:MAG TPA: NAD-dependent succinate-semialdehyde dehydrogenase [Cytophagaceae bacterium]|nr:NAD-dependent succinate-semialdehyde dehydrogenase [Cytophagaceae bacterium]
MLQSINPYTQLLLKQYPENTLEELDKKITKTERAFYSWKEKSFAERAVLFQRLSEFLSARKEEYATLITLEMGKPFLEAIAEIEKCAESCIYYADKAEFLLQAVTIESKASEAHQVYEPIGVVFAIMPWNFPFWQVFRCAVPAMMAGNTILLKPSPNVTGCSLAIEEAFKNAGFAEGSFTSIQIQDEMSSYIIEKKETKAVSLTGSERAGKIVASEAGKNLKKIVLELGGSDPFIVLDDADLNSTVACAIKGRLQNTGQSCIAAKRFIIMESIAKRFQEELINGLMLLKVGDPMDPTTNLGPLVRKDLKDRLLSQVKKSLSLGATLEYGALGETSDNFFHPVVLKNLKPGMPAYEEELFGPVFSIFVVKDEAEAVKIANDSKFGLGASIWTKDTARAKQLASKIETGMVFINDIVRSDVRLPFGGTKLSGYGRELAEVGIKEFVNIKTVYIK